MNGSQCKVLTEIAIPACVRVCVYACTVAFSVFLRGEAGGRRSRDKSAHTHTHTLPLKKERERERDYQGWRDERKQKKKKKKEIFLHAFTSAFFTFLPRLIQNDALVSSPLSLTSSILSSFALKGTCCQPLRNQLVCARAHTHTGCLYAMIYASVF